MERNNADWVEKYLDDLLSHWLQVAPTENGIFNPYLDRQWQRKEGIARTLVSQCRLIYNFARATEYNCNRPGHEAESVQYAAAAQQGIEALQKYFLNQEIDRLHGLAWRWSCDHEGNVLDTTSDAYGHAFVILGLATAARALKNNEYRDMALQTWDFMKWRFADSYGGMVWHIGPGGEAKEEERSQNPIMHTFEALLALAPLDDSGLIRQDTARIWQFIAARFEENSGCLPEWYHGDWTPLTEGRRSVIDIGHAFEWAFLLSEAHAIELQNELPEEDANLLEAAQKFLDFGLGRGYDIEAGGIFNEVDMGWELTSRQKGWWQQCEAIRTLHRFAMRHATHEYRELLNHSLDFVYDHFVDHEYGGWYTHPPTLEGTPNLDKGNPYKLDYHVANMCWELLSD